MMNSTNDTSFSVEVTNENASSEKENNEKIVSEKCDTKPDDGTTTPVAAVAKEPEANNETGDNDSVEQDNSSGAWSSCLDEEETNDTRDLLAKFFKTLGISGSQTEETHEKVISSLTIDGIAQYIKEDKCQNIIVMTGAGISTSAGIPDFRSPGTGLYSKLEKYNLPYPQAIFELEYFKKNPEPFFLLAKELYPGNYKPTPSHYFIKLLSDKGLLLRNYTQNIDGLELVAGVDEENIIAAHGSFYTSHCIECEKEYSEPWMKENIFASNVPKCLDCNNYVKPDIVFFGENLPFRFFRHMGQVQLNESREKANCELQLFSFVKHRKTFALSISRKTKAEVVSDIADDNQDFRKADLLIVIGTSLTVQPFASLINRVGDHVPRLLINKEKCGQSFFSGGFDFDGPNNYRDVVLLGNCDDGCQKLSEILGWKHDLDQLINGIKDEESSEEIPSQPPIIVEDTSSCR